MTGENREYELPKTKWSFDTQAQDRKSNFEENERFDWGTVNERNNWPGIAPLLVWGACSNGYLKCISRQVVSAVMF